MLTKSKNTLPNNEKQRFLQNTTNQNDQQDHLNQKFKCQNPTTKKYTTLTLTLNLQVHTHKNLHQQKSSSPPTTRAATNIKSCSHNTI